MESLCAPFDYCETSKIEKIQIAIYFEFLTCNCQYHIFSKTLNFPSVVSHTGLTKISLAFFICVIRSINYYPLKNPYNVPSKTRPTKSSVKIKKFGANP